MNKKLNYEAPEMEVVKLSAEQKILDGSFNATRQSFTTEDAETWGE